MTDTMNINGRTEQNEKHPGTLSVVNLDLRDYFAAKAPLESLKFGDVVSAAEFAECEIPKTDGELIVVLMKAAAKAAFIYADAMLKARSE